MKKFWKKVLASSLAFICTVTAGVAAIATGGFGLFNTAQTEQANHNKQLSFGNFFGNGITLTASADEATTSETGTPVFEDVVSDAGTVSSLTVVNTASVPFAYRDLTLYENQTVVKIGIPIKTVTDYTTDSLFTVYVVSYDEPLTTFTQVSEHKLTIPANTFTSNTVNEWYYFDTNITVGENQTLGFTSSSDTIRWGFLSSSKAQYALYNKLFSGYGTSAYGFFDVYTSDSSTPSTPSEPIGTEIFGYTNYDFLLHPGYISSSGEVKVESGHYYMNFVAIEDLFPTLDNLDTEVLKIEVEQPCVVSLVLKNTNGTYEVCDDIMSDTWLTLREFVGVSHLGLYVWHYEQAGLTLEEAQAGVALTVPLFYHGEEILTATVNDYATDKSVTWSVAWKDPTSEWANGKDVLDYVNVIPTSADGLTASVRWIQAFAEQVVVTVTSVSNPDISAGCTVDYIQKLLDYHFEFYQGNTSYAEISLYTPSYYALQQLYSIGTIEGTFEYTIEFSITDDFFEALEENEDYINACDLAGSGAIQINGTIVPEIDDRDNCYAFYAELFFDHRSQVDGVAECLNNAIHNVANEFEAAKKPIMIAVASCTYSCSTVYSKSFDIELEIDTLSTKLETLEVTSLELDNTTLTF